MRRGLGFKLRAERLLLPGFVDFVERTPRSSTPSSIRTSPSNILPSSNSSASHHRRTTQNNVGVQITVLKISRILRSPTIDSRMRACGAHNPCSPRTRSPPGTRLPARVAHPRHHRQRNPHAGVHRAQSPGRGRARPAGPPAMTVAIRKIAGTDRDYLPTLESSPAPPPTSSISRITSGAQSPSTTSPKCCASPGANHRSLTSSSRIFPSSTSNSSASPAPSLAPTVSATGDDEMTALLQTGNYAHTAGFSTDQIALFPSTRARAPTGAPGVAPRTRWRPSRRAVFQPARSSPQP